MSRRDDLQQLIINYGRRLQKLQEQQALMGLDTPPHALIEIEDIQAKIAELEEKLAALAEADFVVVPSYPMPGQQTQPYPQPPTKRAIFVGRQAQLVELERYWQEAYQQQKGKVVFLVGEAGIGKTSLVREFSQGVLAKYPQAQYAEAQCDQIAGDISPYAPFVQLLNNLTEQATRRGKHWSVEFIREIGPDILGMVPVAGPILATAAKGADFAWRKRRGEDAGLDRPSQFGQQDIFQQFTDTFRNLARRKNPLLLFVDDWHWADTSSTTLLFHLARQLSNVPILLLATYRPHDAQARQHPILAIRTEMERYQLCAGVSLDFLSRDDVIAYLNSRFPKAQFEPNFIEWLLDITNGNALFTKEYVNFLENEKLLTSDGQLVGNLAQILPPANVEAVIRGRLGFLDQESRDMLAYGSVEGEQFTTLVLSRLLDLKPLSLLKRLRAIEETHHLIASLGQQIVYEQQTTVYHFVHTLIYRTLYNSLEAEERAEINRLLLELRGEIYAHADATTQARLAPELMAHAGEAQEYLAQARYAVAAAGDAAGRHAHAEALKQCSIGLQALEKITKATPEAEEIRIDLLLRRGRTEEKIGAQQQAFETYRQAEILARESQEKPRLVQVLNKLGWILRKLGNYEQALNYHQASIPLSEAMEDKMELAYAYHGLGLIHVRRNEDEQAWAFCRKALAIWEELAYERGIASIYDVLGTICRNQGNYEEALKWYHQAVTINQKLGNKSQLAWNYENIGVIFQRQGNIGAASKLYQQTRTIWEEQGYRRGSAIATYNMGRVYQIQSDYEQALICYREALTIQEELGDKSWIARSQNSIGQIYQAQGDFYQALSCYQKALTIREKLGNLKDITETRQRIAEVEAKLAADSEVDD
ncbi:MAG: tetratricopeptide repeat protein [Anaerolineae bacterium]|nr:tetratricopeptide repeat protein [Anaerolineae bacterium]